MEIIDRININDKFIVTSVGDQFDSFTLRGKTNINNIGDVVIHRNMNDPTKYDIKIIVAEVGLPQVQQQLHMQNIMNTFGNELLVHPTIYSKIIGKAFSLFATPTICMLFTSDCMESLYLFYTGVTSSLRVLNNKAPEVHSGILH